MIIKDFTRITPKQGYEEWPSKLDRMNELFQQAEIQMVKKGFRVAAITQVNPNDLDIFLEKINKNCLLFTPLKKMPVPVAFSSNFRPVEPNQPFLWSGCLTRTYKEGQQFKEVSSKGDDRAIGKMLGYPNCCIDYFIKAYPVDSCPIWVDLNGKTTGFPECNGMLRYFGPKITAHFSCSPVCQATKEIGKIWFKTMQEIDRELANEMYQLLAGPITWNSYQGVVQIETPYFVGLNNTLLVLKKPRIITWKRKEETPKKNFLEKKSKTKKHNRKNR